MIAKERWLRDTGYLKGGLICVFLVFLFMGCATAPGGLDPNIKGPQVVVQPDAVTLGVVSVTRTPIVFMGKGFQPDDSVFIELLGVDKKGEKVNVPIADANVDSNGCFTAKVSTLVKVTELLRAKIGSNKKMETAIIITQPTIPPGVYTAKVVSMESDAKADCKLTLMAPYSWDKFKDWVGVRKEKIIKK
ncbi:MAG: hypothetical protein JRJ51_16285 [Deltaproteobacteria bacterium]|nr:hypothetical protein [Deltaproteobacteria bacterium]